MESVESSSPMVVRSVAAELAGLDYKPFLLAGWQTRALRILGRLPMRAARVVIPRFQAGAALDPRKFLILSLADMVEHRLQDYFGIPEKVPAIVTGAALGGAAAQISLAAGGPFLPTAFVFTLRGGSPQGDVQEYFRLADRLTRKWTGRNSGAITIQHYDPLHDGWLTRRVNHVRVKLTDLPKAYRQFIRRRLQPGGAVIYLDCRARWLRYRLDERRVFQVGGWGGIPAQEFLTGSERIRRSATAEGLTRFDWKLGAFELEEGPESEWGVEPDYGDALEAFCQEEGIRFTRLVLPHPHDASRVAFAGQRELLKKEGREPTGVSVEIFTQYDPGTVRRAGLLPLWLVFNTSDSLDFLREMVAQFPANRPVFFSPLITFSLTPDLVAFDEWAQALGCREWINCGARRSHYPADALRLTDWQDQFRRPLQSEMRELHSRLDAEELANLAAAVISR